MATTTKVTNVVAVNDAKEAGAVCWWRLSGTVEHDSLKAVWETLGLDTDLLLNDTTPAAALRRSMHYFHKGRVLVRALGKGAGFAVVHETVDDALDMHHRVLMNARLVRQDDDNELLTFTPGVDGEVNEKLAAEIRARYEHALSTYSVDDISNWMSSVLLPAVNAVGLRDKGGIYFVPRTSIDTWRNMVTAIREVSSHQVFEMPALSSAEAIDAILDAVSREAQEAAERMEVELIEEDLSVTALKNRVAKLDKALNKVTKYESLLGTNLDTLRERMTSLSAQMAAAIFTAQAQADQADDEAA